MANSRRYRDDDAWRALRFEVCVACRSRLCRECEMAAVTQERDGDASDSATAQHLHLCLACSTRLPNTQQRRPGALLHSTSLQDDRLLSRPGVEYRERGGHTTSAKAIFDDSEEDLQARRPPKADSDSGSRRGRRRLPSESTLSSLIASTRASFDAWRRRKKVSAPALIPVPPPIASVSGATVFSHERSRSVDADSRSNRSFNSDMELPTIDLRSRRRQQQRRPTSTSIDYSFSTSELELSTVDLRQARDCKRRPTSTASVNDYSSSDSELELSTVDLRRAHELKRRPSGSMPDVLPRSRRGGSSRGVDTALRLATAMAPSRPDPLSISYVKHYK